MLFVAESPPSDPDHYFYFEHVPQGDSLWSELMKALYGCAFGDTKRERKCKAEWLTRFQECDYFLIDAVKEPIDRKVKDPARVRLIRARADRSAQEAAKINPEKIVLVKKTVYEGLIDTYRARGLPVVNIGPIPFPGSGQQSRFQRAMDELRAKGHLPARPIT